MKRLIIFVFSGLILSFPAFAEPVKIGIITDLSAGMASWGQQTRIGAEIALDEILGNGGDVKIFFGDHQLQTKTAITEFQKLTELDKVDAIYSEFTPTTVAIAPLAKNKRIPVIYAAAAVSPAGVSPYIFKSYVDYEQGCKKVAEYWKSLGVKSVGSLKINLEFGELCSKGLKQVYPQATELPLNPGEEVASLLLSLKAKKVEAIMNVGFEPDLLRMLKSLRNMNWEPLISSQFDAVAGQVRILFPEMLEKITIFSIPALAPEFISRVRSKQPDNKLVSIEAAGLAYLHIKQFFDAVSSCSKGDSECIAAHIAEAKPDSITGFEKWKDRVAGFKIRLLRWQNGREIEVI